MTTENKIRIARLVAIVAVILGLRFLGGGRAWDYLVDHVWLAPLLVILALFVLLFGRGLYIHSRRKPEEQAKLDGAQNAKP
jgi:hypothetical protein